MQYLTLHIRINRHKFHQSRRSLFYVGSTTPLPQYYHVGEVQVIFIGISWRVRPVRQMVQCLQNLNMSDQTDMNVGLVWKRKNIDRHSNTQIRIFVALFRQISFYKASR